jgi:hypothetical protein
MFPLEFNLSIMECKSHVHVSNASYVMCSLAGGEVFEPATSVSSTQEHSSLVDDVKTS